MFSFNFFDTLIIFQRSTNFRSWCWWRRRCWFLNSNRLTFIVNIFVRSYNISTFRNFFKGYDFLTAKFRSIKRKLNINCSISRCWCKLSCCCNRRTKFVTCFLIHQTTRYCIFSSRRQVLIRNSINQCDWFSIYCFKTLIVFQSSSNFRCRIRNFFNWFIGCILCWNTIFTRPMNFRLTFFNNQLVSTRIKLVTLRCFQLFQIPSTRLNISKFRITIVVSNQCILRKSTLFHNFTCRRTYNII